MEKYKSFRVCNAYLAISRETFCNNPCKVGKCVMSMELAAGKSRQKNPQQPGATLIEERFKEQRWCRISGQGLFSGDGKLD